MSAPSTEDGQDHRRLDVHDPCPPTWAVLSAENVIRAALEPDNGVLRRWRRSTAQPVVRVEDRYLVGTLDLRALDFQYPLEFVRCRFENPPDVRQASLAGLDFTGCWLPGLHARNVISENDVTLADTTVHGAPVDLTDARVRGSVVLDRSRFSNPGGRAVHADRLEVGGALLATELEAVGEVRIAGARIGGNVNLSGAVIHNVAGCALDANGLHVGGNLICGRSRVPDGEARAGRLFRSTGWLLFTNAYVASDFSMRGAKVRPSSAPEPEPEDPPTVPTPAQPPAPPAADDPYHDSHATLVGDRIRVDGDLDLDEEFTSRGTVRIVNGHVGGSLRLTRAEVNVSAARAAGRDVRAVHLDGTQILGNIEAEGLRLTGQWHSLEIKVRGSVRLDWAVLDNADDDVWVARRCEIGGNLDCRDSEVYGSVMLQGARVGANLDFRASRLGRPGRYTRDRNVKPCLDVRAAQVGRDLICAEGRRPFRSTGDIRLSRVSVGRELNLRGAELGARPDPAVPEAERATVSVLNAFGAHTQELALTLAHPAWGRISLRQVRCASLNDNEALWRATGGVDVDDFRYESLHRAIDLEDDAGVLRRLAWLRGAMGGSYVPSAYDQLAAMLRASGNEEHADTVLIAKQRDRYSALARGFRVLGPMVVFWSWLQRWMVGYGYRPSRALGWLLLLLVAGTVWFSLYPGHCLLIRGDPPNFPLYHFCPLTNQDDHLVWNPFLFTLDLLVPIVDFGNKNRWALTGVSQWISTMLIASGWILATTVAAGLTRMLRRP